MHGNKSPRLNVPSTFVELEDERLRQRGVCLWLKRDDLIHPELPGNKWRKLKYNLDAAHRQGFSTLLTFGGTYSNHLRATAAAGHYFGFSTVGVVRGEEHRPLNPSLRRAVEFGMRLVYLDRATYRDKSDPDLLASFRTEFGSFYLLPEGGSNSAALRGCAELPAEISEPFDVICCPCGTGGTLAGIAAGLSGGQRAHGFAGLKGAEFLTADVESLQRQTYGCSTGNWTIEYGYHCGGFAKRSPQLDEFIHDFHSRHGFLLEWVYVAKMMFGIFDLIEQRAFHSGSTLVAVVTGPPCPD